MIVCFEMARIDSETKRKAKCSRASEFGALTALVVCHKVSLLFQQNTAILGIA
jgi:hypothetical protein